MFSRFICLPIRLRPSTTRHAIDRGFYFPAAIRGFARVCQSWSCCWLCTCAPAQAFLRDRRRSCRDHLFNAVVDIGQRLPDAMPRYKKLPAALATADELMAQLLNNVAFLSDNRQCRATPGTIWSQQVRRGRSAGFDLGYFALDLSQSFSFHRLASDKICLRQLASVCPRRATPLCFRCSGSDARK